MPPPPLQPPVLHVDELLVTVLFTSVNEPLAG
jgi:hypothetical protein